MQKIYGIRLLLILFLISSSLICVIFIASRLHFYETENDNNFRFATTTTKTTTSKQESRISKNSNKEDLSSSLLLKNNKLANADFKLHVPAFFQIRENESGNQTFKRNINTIDSTGRINEIQISAEVDPTQKQNYCFSDHAVCIQQCLVKSNDERRVDKFLKSVFSKRYKSAIQMLIRGLSSDDENDYTSSSSVMTRFSRSDAFSLLTSLSSSRKNPVGLWFCGELCRFVGESEETEENKSIYFETRFEEGGPKFCF
jgi:hypothetical protein